jgi:hypothetical protein
MQHQVYIRVIIFILFLFAVLRPTNQIRDYAQSGPNAAPIGTSTGCPEGMLTINNK